MKTLLLILNLGMVLMWIGAVTTFTWFLLTEWEKLNTFERSLFAIGIVVAYTGGLVL